MFWARCCAPSATEFRSVSPPHLSAELPLVVRGLFFDRWRPADQPERYRTLEQFLDRVRQDLGPIEDVSPHAAAEAVFATLTRHVSPGQVEHVREALPEEIRSIWRTQSADGFNPLEPQPDHRAQSV